MFITPKMIFHVFWDEIKSKLGLLLFPLVIGGCGQMPEYATNAGKPVTFTLSNPDKVEIYCEVEWNTEDIEVVTTDAETWSTTHANIPGFVSLCCAKSNDRTDSALISIEITQGNSTVAEDETEAYPADSCTDATHPYWPGCVRPGACETGYAD